MRLPRILAALTAAAALIAPAAPAHAGTGASEGRVLQLAAPDFVHLAPGCVSIDLQYRINLPRENRGDRWYLVIGTRPTSQRYYEKIHGKGNAVGSVPVYFCTDNPYQGPADMIVARLVDTETGIMSDVPWPEWTAAVAVQPVASPARSSIAVTPRRVTPGGTVVVSGVAQVRWRGTWQAAGQVPGRVLVRPAGEPFSVPAGTTTTAADGSWTLVLPWKWAAGGKVRVDFDGLDNTIARTSTRSVDVVVRTVRRR